MDKKKDRLQTQRLILRAFDECDRGRMAELLCEETIKKTYMLPDFDDRKQAEALFERLMKLSRSEDHFEYGICFGDALIGFVNDCGIRDTSIELGYVIAPEYQGRGFATEAVRACIDELFRMGFTHIRAGYFEENTASCRVMQKCGMRKMDLEDDIEYRGRVRHCLYYGIERRREMMQYTQITKDDFDRFRELAAAYYREGEDADTPQAVMDGFIRILFDKIMDGGIEGCFVKAENECIGFALWAMDNADFEFSEMQGFGTILEIGLIKSRRGAGHGKELAAYVEERLRGKGALQCYVSAYGPAQMFWKRCGYAENGRTAGNGLPIMVKMI